jgi:putative restriction endonuclease
MKFKGRVIPSIPPAEKAYLDKIRTESKESAQWRNIAYAVMNQTLRGANLEQKDGVALKELSSKKDNGQIGPMTIYSNNLDMGNVIELAIHPEKLADALRLPADDAWAWLNHLQEQVARTATSKTSLKYPRVGIRSEEELATVLDAWDKLVAERKWPAKISSGQNDSASHGASAASISASTFDLARVEKAAPDACFDLTVLHEEGWLVFRSMAFPLALGVMAQAGDNYRVGFSDAAWGQKVAHDCGTEARPEPGPWLTIVDPVTGDASLHGMIQRAGKVAHLLAGEAATRFADEMQRPPAATEVERLVIQRVGQNIFRQSLIDYWQGRCAVTRLSVESLLRASHIKPWARCDSDAERLDVFNGLLLAPHLDALFDGGWISFDDDAGLLVSSELPSDQQALLGVKRGWRLTEVAEQHRNYLAWHRREIFLR